MQMPTEDESFGFVFFTLSDNHTWTWQCRNVILEQHGATLRRVQSRMNILFARGISYQQVSQGRFSMKANRITLCPPPLYAAASQLQFQLHTCATRISLHALIFKTLCFSYTVGFCSNSIHPVSEQSSGCQIQQPGQWPYG